jgi:hypothetical protein
MAKNVDFRTREDAMKRLLANQSTDPAQRLGSDSPEYKKLESGYNLGWRETVDEYYDRRYDEFQEWTAGRFRRAGQPESTYKLFHPGDQADVPQRIKRSHVDEFLGRPTDAEFQAHAVRQQTRPLQAANLAKRGRRASVFAGRAKTQKQGTAPVFSAMDQHRRQTGRGASSQATGTLSMGGIFGRMGTLG